ncbi:DNA primase small subunit [Planococcus citri]|uniref:DNA primase small subunit n=1 Tax=Planococcus citri TaxID=170843 RepID=UPI0031F9DAB5
MSSSDTSRDLLPLYYKRLFPYEDYFEWLSYGENNPKYIENREFSFTLDEDVYIRYQSFISLEEFKKEVQSHRCPSKIDIGAVYTIRPREHRNNRALFHPLEKELVFDIDMTDYDEVRTCCSGAGVCNKCWKFMSIACKILDLALKEDFGWKLRLWVFSGRRGIHCWVCDESARKLDGTQRSAVAEYLQVLTGGEKQAKKVQLFGDNLHPSVSRALNIIKKVFKKMMIEEQDVLRTKEGCDKLLKMISDEKLQEKVNAEIFEVDTSAERWDKFVAVAELHNQQTNMSNKTKHIVEEIMLQYTYPRLDINVTKGLNHLLKSPFCVHPKTGKVCVPFSPKLVDSFDPSAVPTLELLLDEIAHHDEDNKDAEKKLSEEFRKTSLNKSVKIFREFISMMKKECKKENYENTAPSMDF